MHSIYLFRHPMKMCFFLSCFHLSELKIVNIDLIRGFILILHWEGVKKFVGHLLLCFCSFLYCSKGAFLREKAFIFAAHVGPWSFVCSNVGPPSVWHFHTALTNPKLPWKYIGWQWQESWSVRVSERRWAISPASFVSFCSLWPSRLMKRTWTKCSCWL